MKSGLKANDAAMLSATATILGAMIGAYPAGTSFDSSEGHDKLVKMAKEAAQIAAIAAETVQDSDW